MCRQHGPKQLHRLCTAAGGQQETALSLLSRILGNLVDNPKESKFRRLNPNSEKLKNDLLRHEGALELLSAAGFQPTEDGHLEVPPGAPTAAEAALMAVKRGAGFGGYVAGAKHSSQPEAAAELAVLTSLHSSPDGKEVLQILERILDNVRRYPNNEKYRCINLAKSSGHKVLQALPLLKAAGFEQQSAANGEDLLQLHRVHVDLLERVWAMVWWADRGHDMIKQLPPPQSNKSRALGALLGMVVGDALGAPLGGQDPMAVTVQEVDKAMEMCGGGLWGVAPGQVTGHSELLLCTLSALVEGGHGAFPMEDMALRYGKWGKSLPFRGDRACLQVFARPMPAESMAERAREVNQKSMSCGAIVRCPALAVAAGSPEKAAQLANEDVRLSHANRTMAFACAAYSVALSQLINGQEDVESWLKRSLDRIKSGVKSGHGGAIQAKGAKDPTKEECWAPPGEELVACEQVLQWLRRAKSNEFLEVSDMAAQSLLSHEVGNVEIPFCHAFRHLNSKSSFEDAMRSILAGGGDSSSTACVVGGLLGAAYGVEGIPERWLRAVLSCDQSHGHQRPLEYHPKVLPELCAKLVR